MRLTERGYTVFGLLGAVLLVAVVLNMARIVAGVAIFLGLY